MRRHPARDNCSIAHAVCVLGDDWTILVVREAFLGTRRFADFEHNLGVSKNVLTQRLAHLVKNGVLLRVDVGKHGTRFEYELAPSGRDLMTVMTALRQWGDRWLLGAGHEPMLAFDRRSGRPIPRVRVVGEDGAPLKPRHLQLRPGPGASKATIARLRNVEDAQRGTS